MSQAKDPLRTLALCAGSFVVPWWPVGPGTRVCSAEAQYVEQIFILSL